VADQIIKTGDTWPPLTLTLTESCEPGDPGHYVDGDGDTVRRVDLFTNPPDSIRVVIVAPTIPVITGPGVNVETTDGSSAVGLVAGAAPGLGIPGNRGQVRYMWEAGDTDDPGAYAGEVEVTWDSASTPPAIETFPNDPSSNFTIEMKGDLD
jgi:hypothetical protein